MNFRVQWAISFNTIENTNTIFWLYFFIDLIVGKTIRGKKFSIFIDVYTDHFISKSNTKTVSIDNNFFGVKRTNDFL